MKFELSYYNETLVLSICPTTETEPVICHSADQRSNMFSSLFQVFSYQSVAFRWWGMSLKIVNLQQFML